MIEYKIIYIETDLTEVTEEQHYNGCYFVYYKDLFWSIEDVEDTRYCILETDFKERFKNGLMGTSILKSDVNKIYKPVIELINEVDNQLLTLNEYMIIKKPPVEPTSNHLEYFINDYEVFNVSDLPDYVRKDLPPMNHYSKTLYVTTKDLTDAKAKQWFFDRKIKNGEPVLIVHPDYTFTSDPLRTRKYSVVESGSIPDDVLDELSKSINPTPNLHIIDFYNGYLSSGSSNIKDPNFIITEWFLEQGRENEKILFIWDN